ncbi:MAG: TIGR04211 family SH3 domain-containing protein [Deltaproteobacteria bacterium]
MNRNAKILIILSCCLLVGMASIAHAENRYVVDELIITMRTGQSSQHQIIETLKSGTKLELLKTDKEYSKVRAPDGKEGWVLNQYISSKPTAKLLLASAENKLARLQEENARLKADLKTSTSKNAELASSYQKVSSEQSNLSGELERLQSVAAQPLKLQKENEDLKKQFTELKSEYLKLKQKHQILMSDNERKWFLTGVGVIVLGILIGLIAPRLRPKKKSRW